MSQSNMKPTDPMPEAQFAPVMEEDTCLAWMDNCRRCLWMHGFLTDSENDRVHDRLARWVKSQSGPSAA